MSATVTAKPRTPWLDYVRLGTVFIVVLYHTPPRVHLIDNALPVFFVISGFLYDRERRPRFVDFIKHRSKQILVPYVTLFLICYALWLVVGRSLVGASEQAIPVWQPLVEWALGMPNTVCRPFWFIVCLLVMQIIYFALESVVPRKWLLAVCLTISLGYQLIAYLVPQDLYIPYWNITHAIQSLPFFALGNCLKPQIKQLSFSSPRATAGYLALFALCAFIAVLALSVGSEWLKGVIRVFIVVLGLPAYFGLGKWVAEKLGKRRWVELIVVCGTVYLAFQNYAIGIVKIALDRLVSPGFLDGQLWCKPLVALAVMAVLYPVAWLIDRYAPWLIGNDRPHFRSAKG